MPAAVALKHGNFDTLAEDYARYRPGYSSDVLSATLALTQKPAHAVDFADVGAGTGIWTRMVAARGCRTSAVEPSDPMRAEGKAGNGSLTISWHKGTAEATGLPSGAFDICSMASSFHWADFDAAMDEFRRILRPDGLFVVLWNPRNIDANPLLVEIEAELRRLVPGMKRVSSGRSEFCDTLIDRFGMRDDFETVLYLEGNHVERMTPERYLGAWRSVNDVRVQAGADKFARFLAYVEDRTRGLDAIDAPYVTRAWVVRRR
jgi:SAM-dependent methyltransferase